MALSQWSPGLSQFVPCYWPKCPSCLWVSGKHVPAMKNANIWMWQQSKEIHCSKCMNSICVHVFNLLWVFFLSKALNTCLKCNFQQSHAPADCKTLWAHIHRLPKVLLHPLHCHPKSTHSCNSQEACGMITVENKNCFLYIFIWFSYASEPWFYFLPNLRIQDSFSAIGRRQRPVHTIF